MLNKEMLEHDELVLSIQGVIAQKDLPPVFKRYVCMKHISSSNNKLNKTA